MSYGKSTVPSIRVLLILIVLSTIIPPYIYPDPFAITEEPKNLDFPINSTVNDFAPTISPDGKTLIFNSNRGSKYQDLYISHLTDGVWGNPKPLAVCNSPYNDEAPFLSSDGTILLFSSDRDGSMEMPADSQNRIRVSFDIYWSKMAEGRWGKPQPVPGNVNTMHHEKAPAMSNDGKTLYYTTWEFGTLERTQIMKARYENNAFIDVRPLDGPFNAGYQDLAIIPAEDINGFFFSSNRPGGFGAWDLYFVSFRRGKFGKPVNLGKKVNSFWSELFLTRVDQRYFICSSRDGGKGEFDIYSSYVFQKNTDFETRAIHFDFNSYTIKKESYAYLDALFKFLKENQGVKLEIVGHTDLHGTEEFNKELSLKRALAVQKYLVRKGLHKKMFRVRGAGESTPLINKTGEPYDERNRRTEFKIIR